MNNLHYIILSLTTIVVVLLIINLRMYFKIQHLLKKQKAKYEFNSNKNKRKMLLLILFLSIIMIYCYNSTEIQYLIIMNILNWWYGTDVIPLGWESYFANYYIDREVEISDINFSEQEIIEMKKTLSLLMKEYREHIEKLAQVQDTEYEYDQIINDINQFTEKNMLNNLNLENEKKYIEEVENLASMYDSTLNQLNWEKDEELKDIIKKK